MERAGEERRRGEMMMGAMVVLSMLLAAPSPPVRTAPNVVSEVTVEGNEHISDEAVLAVVQTKPGQPLDRARLEADREAILDTGWFQEVAVVPLPTPKGIKVLFKVVENPVIKAISIEGNTVYTDDILLKVMETKPGQVFNSRLFWRDADRIRDLYAHHGYVADVVDVRVDEQGVLHVAVLEFTVERVEIQGLKKTEPRVVRRVMRLKPGMVFNAGLLASDLARIEGLGFFEQVEREVREGSEPGKVVVVIKVKEMKSGSVAGGLAYSSRYGLVGMLDFTELNFRGLAQRLNLRAEFGEERNSWEFSYHVPWLDAKGTSVGLSVYDRLITQDFYYWGAQHFSTYYDERRKGFTLSASRPVTDRFRLGLTLRNEKVWRGNLYYTPQGIPTSALQALTLQRGRVASLTLDAIADLRDRPFAPRMGQYRAYTLELAGGPLGGPSFLKHTFDLRFYVPVAHKPSLREILYGTPKRKERTHVIAFRLLLGTASKDVPAYEAFFLGGADTHRAYDWYRFYGRNIALLNAEYRVPITRDLWAVAFVDWGDAWGGKWSYQGGQYVYEAEHQKFSPTFGYGFGIRVRTPIGPIRIDYGFGKEGSKAHFAIGQMF